MSTSIHRPNNIFHLWLSTSKITSLCFITLLIGATSAAAQDVLFKRDSIRCKILAETAIEYLYTYLDSNNAAIKTSILKKAVDSVKYNRYTVVPPRPVAVATNVAAPAAGILRTNSTNKDNNLPAKKAVSNDKPKEKTWFFTLGIGLDVSSFLEANSKTGPDKKSFSGTGSLDLGLDYKKKDHRFEMTNEAHWLVNIQKEGLADTDRIQRVGDDLNTLHDLSMGLSRHNKWSLNLIAKTTTSVFTIYNGDYFEDVHKAGKIQGFANPYDITLSPGIKLAPDDYLRVSVSPYSMNFYGLESQRIANTGLYTHDSDANNNYVRFVYRQLGAEVNIWYDRKIGNWLSVQYRISISSDYFDKIGQNGLMNGLFITKIRLLKDLYLAHRAELNGDFAEKPFKPYYSQTVLLSFTKNI